jgi:hypothetical protein
MYNICWSSGRAIISYIIMRRPRTVCPPHICTEHSGWLYVTLSDGVESDIEGFVHGKCVTRSFAFASFFSSSSFSTSHCTKIMISCRVTPSKGEQASDLVDAGRGENTVSLAAVNSACKHTPTISVEFAYNFAFALQKACVNFSTDLIEI